MTRDLHHRRSTEPDTATNAPKKKHSWDNLALRQRIAGMEITHRSVTKELHAAARLATEGTAAIAAAPRRVASRARWWKRLSTG